MEDQKEELSIINSLFKRVWHFCKDVAFSITWVPQRFYLYAAAATLFSTTIFWAILGARLQLHNADQLVDPYMFSTAHTFHGALFPGAHTFLIKWPIFWLLGLVGISSASLVAATVFVTLLAVGALAFVLYKIDRRPLVLGSLYLALALVLLLIPAQPYVGAILPVNMAMLTTRNLEYALYLASLVLFVRAQSLRSFSFWLGVCLLGVLVASDKLFVGLALGGAGLMLAAYALFSNWRMVTFAVRWLVGGVAATVGATLLLLVIEKLHITHLVGSSGVSPYAVGAGAKNMVMGVGYTVLGVLTNFGANPAYDNRTLATLPHDIVVRLITVGGLLHLLAAVLFCIGIIAVWFVVRPLFRKDSEQFIEPDRAVKLSLALIWSTIAAIGTFVATQHYYAVDARYLTIGLFAVFIATATALRSFNPIHATRMMAMGVALFGMIVIALFNARSISAAQGAAFDEISARNTAIVQMLKRHNVDVLVGDYWRVLPIKMASDGSINTMPLSGCTTPSGVLTSYVWRPNLAKHSFAYLITLDGDGNLTNYPHCTLQQISQAHGRPNAVQVVAGTIAAPKEALLFYDQGSHPSVATPLTPPVAPLLPVNVDQLVKTSCAQPTIMNFVAHEDDDLLFLSPDLLHDLRSGSCVRTVYMTAGDSGFGKFYWLSRQLGTEAAYSTMLGIRNVWDQQIIVLPTGQYATVATPRDNTKVSLIFLNLPDGNIHGDGFPDSGHESLEKLQNGTIPTLHAIDGQSAYNPDQLVLTLMTLMDTYQPAEIRTQANMPSEVYPDHSDHIATGLFAEAAAQRYDQQHFGGVVSIPVKRYVGYPVHSFDANVSEEDLAAKQQAFFAYAQYDKGVCGSIAQCARTPTYDAYLSRQYQDR